MLLSQNKKKKGKDSWKPENLHKQKKLAEIMENHIFHGTVFSWIILNSPII